MSLKATLKDFRAALYEGGDALKALCAASARDAIFKLAHPIGEHVGAEAYFRASLAPLLRAMPDLERRDTIVMAGQTPQGADWVGCCGSYVGTFAKPWLDIVPSGHLAHMRYHEFYRIEDGKIAEMQALWDIPELMMQAGAWPMGPSLGRDWHVPGPASQNGLRDFASGGAASAAIVIDMLEHLTRHPAQGGPEVMQLEKFWHPKMNWYGPAGIGTARGIRGFRHWHQIPFLNAMPDRGAYPDETEFHFIGDGPYVGVTGWPDMVQTISAPGWLGIAPTGQKVSMRSLDFWRVENGLIRENWVLVDLLDVWDQIGVDVLGRMREMNKAKIGFDPETGKALQQG